MTGPTELTTDRLLLEPLTGVHTTALHAIFADPETWRHLPSGRHREIGQTARMIERAEQSWQRFGLGPWAVRERSSDASAPRPVIGTAGCGMLRVGDRDGAAWNLGYRLARSTWGRGYATEACRPALTAAATAEPEVPVTARALTANPASVRVLQKLGLIELWRGVSAETRMSDPDDSRGLRRVIFADRPVDGELVAGLIDLG